MTHPERPHSGKLLVISGPTAVGKGTVVQEMLRQDPTVELSVSATTRAPRPGEQDGKSYYFVSKTEFEAMISNGELLEYATVHQKNYYGTPKAPVLSALQQGKNVILEIDIQGAYQVKKSFSDAILLFIAPPSWEELVSRLQGRGTETVDEQHRRLETAKVELEESKNFDLVITNDVVQETAEDILQIFR